jgi:integrase
MAMRLARYSNTRDWAVIDTAAYYTGWCQPEILGLTWNRVNLRARTVRLDPGTTKNQEGRTVYLDGEVLDILITFARGGRSRISGMPGIRHVRPWGLRKNFFTIFAVLRCAISRV